MEWNPREVLVCLKGSIPTKTCCTFRNGVGWRWGMKRNAIIKGKLKLMNCVMIRVTTDLVCIYFWGARGASAGCCRDVINQKVGTRASLYGRRP